MQFNLRALEQKEQSQRTPPTAVNHQNSTPSSLKERHSNRSNDQNFLAFVLGKAKNKQLIHQTKAAQNDQTKQQTEIYQPKQSLQTQNDQTKQQTETYQPKQSLQTQNDQTKQLTEIHQPKLSIQTKPTQNQPKKTRDPSCEQIKKTKLESSCELPEKAALLKKTPKNTLADTKRIKVEQSQDLDSGTCTVYPRTISESSPSDKKLKKLKVDQEVDYNADQLQDCLSKSNQKMGPKLRSSTKKVSSKARDLRDLFAGTKSNQQSTPKRGEKINLTDINQDCQKQTQNPPPLHQQSLQDMLFFSLEQGRREQAARLWETQQLRREHFFNVAEYRLSGRLGYAARIRAADVFARRLQVLGETPVLPMIRDTTDYVSALHFDSSGQYVACSKFSQGLQILSFDQILDAALNSVDENDTFFCSKQTPLNLYQTSQRPERPAPATFTNRNGQNFQSDPRCALVVGSAGIDSILTGREEIDSSDSEDLIGSHRPTPNLQGGLHRDSNASREIEDPLEVVAKYEAFALPNPLSTFTFGQVNEKITLECAKFNPVSPQTICCAFTYYPHLWLLDIEYSPEYKLSPQKTLPSTSSGLFDLVWTSPHTLCTAGRNGELYLFDLRAKKALSRQISDSAKTRVSSLAFGEALGAQSVVFGANHHGALFSWDLRKAGFFESGLINKFDLCDLTLQNKENSFGPVSICLDPADPAKLAFQFRASRLSGVLDLGAKEISYQDSTRPTDLGNHFDHVFQTRIEVAPRHFPIRSALVPGGLSPSHIVLKNCAPSFPDPRVILHNEILISGLLAPVVCTKFHPSTNYFLCGLSNSQIIFGGQK